MDDGAGSCFLMDPEGNSVWMWWRFEEAGTSGCPLSCGASGTLGGTGDLAGIAGEGTFKTTAQFPDLTGAGVWAMKWKKK